MVGYASFGGEGAQLLSVHIFDHFYEFLGFW